MGGPRSRVSRLGMYSLRAGGFCGWGVFGSGVRLKIFGSRRRA